MRGTNDIKHLIAFADSVAKTVANIESYSRDMDDALNSLYYDSLWLLELANAELAERKAAEAAKKEISS